MRLLLFTGIGLLLFCYRHLDHVTRQNPTPWRVPFIEEMSSAYVVMLTVPLILGLVRRYPPGWSTWAVHMAGAVGIGVLQTTGFYAARLLVYWLLGWGVYDYGILWIRYFMEMPMQLLSYAMVGGAGLYWENRQRAMLLELENLRLQLQPHFLFNTLNMISSVVYEDPAKADEMLCRLSEYLREALRRNPAQEVPLEEEMASAKAYLTILEARFEAGRTVEWEMAEGIGRALVPHFLLQPLAENSIRHGLYAIRGWREGGSLVLVLEDSGEAGEGGAGLGMGLGNTRKRLEGLYGARGAISLETGRAGRGTVVRVTLPYREAA